MNKIEKLKKYAPALLRTGIAIVFLWFGFSQIKNPAQWTRMIPEYASFIPFEQTTLIYFNGGFEIIFATLLLLGLWTRFVSFLLGLHLLHIVTMAGYGAIGARDFALALATFSIFLNGADEFCLDKFLKKNSKDYEEETSDKTVSEQRE